MTSLATLDLRMGSRRVSPIQNFPTLPKKTGDVINVVISKRRTPEIVEREMKKELTGKKTKQNKNCKIDGRKKERKTNRGRNDENETEKKVPFSFCAELN